MAQPNRQPMTEDTPDEVKYPNRYVMGTHPQDEEDATHIEATNNVTFTVSHPPTASAEERVVDPDTGGAKGRKESELAFVDPVALLALGRVAGKGTRKYDKYNYLRGFDYSLSANALLRHFLAFWSGEDVDPESGEPHAVHTAWHALCLASFVLRNIGNDDRPPR